MKKHCLFIFLILFVINTSFAMGKSVPAANCTYSVVNGWTQTISYQCNPSINLNGAKIVFSVDNPAGLNNLNSVWGFINLSQYPSNPVLTLNGNAVTLNLTFANGTVMLNAGQITNISYSTNNNVKVTNFEVFPAGANPGDASLSVSLISAKPADVSSGTVAVNVRDGANNNFPLTVPWGGSASLSKLNSHASYSLSANPVIGTKQPYTFVFTPSTIILNSGNNVVSMTSSTNTTQKPVNGWPKYLAMGAVTDNTTNTTVSLQSRPIDAIFKYGGMGGNGDPGQIIYPIFDLQTAIQAQTLNEYYQQHQIKNIVKPVMVVYTAQMSGGTSFTDFEKTNLTMHYITLLLEAQKLQSYKTTQNPYPASIILNPDLFGMIQQENLLPALNQAISTVSLQTALKTAICYITHTINTPYGQNLNYEALFKAIRSKTTDNWSAMSTWDQYKMQYFDDCTVNPVVPGNITIPAFTNDFPGWVQSTNWLLKEFAPNVTFGWQENLWAVGSSNWVHQNYDPAILKSQISDPTAATILATKAYSAPYAADFLVFDKYEMDSIPASTGIGYLYNARDLNNVLLFVKNISESLGTIPVMLWQLPGGHLQVTNDIDTRLNHASSEPDYFFGNTANPLPNLQSFILNTPLPVSIYGTNNIKTYLSMDESGTTSSYTWQTSHLQQAANSHIFAILWGGGNTTSVGVFPSDDNGWLANKIINYYKNPIIINPAK